MPDPVPGQSDHVGRYRLLHRLAIGGTAEVFVAAAPRLGDQDEVVVLKRILPQHAEDPRFHYAFEREARVVAALRHPSVVQLLDYGEIGGVLFLALEYVDGLDLGRMLSLFQRDGEKLPPSLVAHIADRVAEALDYVHTCHDSDGTPLRIVHRDVSPQNVLLAKDGAVKLADFGIARSALDLRQTTAGMIKGKFAYMAPEQAQPGTPLDGRTDLFGLGAMLYEMLFDDPPFLGESEVETLDRLASGRYALDPRWLAAEDRPLVPILQGLLAADPAERYPSAAQLQSDLRAYLTTKPPVGTDAISARVIDALSRTATEQGVDQHARELLSPGADRADGGTLIVVKRHGADGSPATPPLETQPSTLRRRWLPVTVAIALLAVGVTYGLWGWVKPPTVPAPPRPAATNSASPATADASSTEPAPRHTPTTASQPAPSRADVAADLHISSTPPGAAISLMGKPAGKTPRSLRAPAGAFSVELRRRGYRRWRRTFHTLPAQGRVHGKLRRQVPAAGKLTINSVPWTRVFIDGKPIGTTPVTGRPTAPGKRRVVLTDRHGRVLRAFVATVRANRTSTHSFYLAD